MGAPAKHEAGRPMPSMSTPSRPFAPDVAPDSDGSPATEDAFFEARLDFSISFKYLDRFLNKL